MRITMVNTINLNKLYDACYNKSIYRGSTDKLPTFGDRLISLFNHVEISLMLTDVTPLDAFLLKVYSTKCTRLSNKRSSLSAGEASPDLKKYGKILDLIHHDPTIKSKYKDNYMYFFGPGNMIVGEMTVSFSGPELFQFFTLEPEKFFINATDEKCLNESRKLIKDFNVDTSDDNPISKTIVKYIADIFHSEYTKFATRYLNSIDLFSDTILFKYFSNHNEKVPIRLSYMKNPCLELDFETLKSQENINTVVENYRNMVPQFVKDNALENTTLEFTLYTDFYVFLQLYEYLPKRFFTTIEDLKIPFKTREVFIPDTFDTFKTRLAARYEEVVMNMDSKEKSALEKFRYVFMNSKISYTMNVTCDEINAYIAPLKKNSDLYDDTSLIITKLLRFSVAAFKMV